MGLTHSNELVHASVVNLKAQTVRTVKDDKIFHECVRRINKAAASGETAVSCSPLLTKQALSLLARQDYEIEFVKDDDWQYANLDHYNISWEKVYDRQNKNHTKK